MTIPERAAGQHVRRSRDGAGNQCHLRGVRGVDASGLNDE